MDLQDLPKSFAKGHWGYGNGAEVTGVISSEAA